MKTYQQLLTETNAFLREITTFIYQQENYTEKKEVVEESYEGMYPTGCYHTVIYNTRPRAARVSNLHGPIKSLEVLLECHTKFKAFDEVSKMKQIAEALNNIKTALDKNEYVTHCICKLMDTALANLEIDQASADSQSPEELAAQIFSLKLELTTAKTQQQENQQTAIQFQQANSEIKRLQAVVNHLEKQHQNSCEEMQAMQVQLEAQEKQIEAQKQQIATVKKQLAVRAQTVGSTSNILFASSHNKESLGNIIASTTVANPLSSSNQMTAKPQ